MTEPLGNEIANAFTPTCNVVDDRFTLNYYRPLPDGRLLWGARLATTSPLSKDELHKRMIEDLRRVYPQLATARAAIVWGGRISYGYSKMPLIGQQSPGLWYCTGFGGHGLVPTHLAGELIASAIAENDRRWEVFAELFPLRYVGWPLTGILGRAAYYHYRLRDWLALTLQNLGF